MCTMNHVTKTLHTQVCNIQDREEGCQLEAFVYHNSLKIGLLKLPHKGRHENSHVSAKYSVTYQFIFWFFERR